MFEYSKSGMFNLRFTNQAKYYRPPVDVIETETGFVLRIEIAGMKKEDFEIKFDKNIISITGVRRDPIRNNTFHQMEIHFGEFQIEVIINQAINPDSIAAEYQNGFLEVMLKKAEIIDIPINDKESH
jgi:HSP20 family protein